MVVNSQTNTGKQKGKAPEESCFTLFINKYFKKHKTNQPACPTWDSDVESFHWSIERDCLAWDDIIDNETLIKYTTEYMERYIHTEIKSRGYSPLDKIKMALEIDKINTYIQDILQVHHTKVERVMLDFEAVKKGLNNYISQNDMYEILRKLYRQSR